MTIKVRTFAAGYSIAPIGLGLWRWRVHFPAPAAGFAFGRSWAMFAARSYLRGSGLRTATARKWRVRKAEQLREA